MAWLPWGVCFTQDLFERFPMITPEYLVGPFTRCDVSIIVTDGQLTYFAFPMFTVRTSGPTGSPRCLDP